MIFFVKWNLLTGIVAATAVGVQKIFGRQLGHRWRKTVWMMLALRLCFPFEIPMGIFWQRFFTISISNRFSERLMQRTNGEKQIQLAAPSEWFSGENRLLILWGIGFLVCFLLHMVQYITWKKGNIQWKIESKNSSVRTAYEKVCERCGVEKNRISICIVSGISSPMLYGFWNVRILLPQEMQENSFYTEEEWIFVFLHEITHWQKRDLWYKLFLQIVNDIFWFCIPMWWVRKMAGTDLEYVCDQIVTRRMNLNEKKQYCNVILKAVSGQARREAAGLVALASEKRAVRNRFANVFSHKVRFAGSMFAAAFSIFVCFFTITIQEPQGLSLLVSDGTMSQEKLCSMCGAECETEMIWGGWVSEKNVDCIHAYAWGDDLQKIRLGIRQRICKKCGNIMQETVSEMKLECHGYNN